MQGGGIGSEARKTSGRIKDRETDRERNWFCAGLNIDKSCERMSIDALRLFPDEK